MNAGNPGAFRIRRLLGPALVTAAMAATLFGPATALASGQPPTVPDVTFWTTVNTPYSGNLLSGATDNEGDALTIYSFTQLASHYGSLSVNLSNGSFTFTPHATWYGSTTTSLWADDGLNRVRATLYINVDRVPIAADQTVTATEDTPLEVTSATLLDGASDPGGFSLSVTAVSNPAGGNVALDAGTATFTPDADLCGTAAGGFDFAVTNEHGGSDTGHATIDITCSNDAPTCAGPVTSSDDEDVEQSGTLACADIDTAELTYALVDQAAHGTAIVNADGSWAYTPDADFHGSDSFTFTASDGADASAPTTMSVTVTAVNDPPVATAGTVNATEDTATGVTSGLLALASDVDGDTLSVSGVAAATGGQVVRSSGVVTFTPSTNVCGATAGGFDYTVSDGHGGTDTAHATVNVSCVNDNPVAVADTVTVVEDTATNVTAPVLANDTDVEGSTLSVASVSTPTGGNATDVAGAVTFTPSHNLCGTGTGGFNYGISDGHGGTASSHVTVNITCVEDAPVAAPDAGATGQNQAAKTFNVIANDTDPDAGDTLSLVSASVDPAKGTASATSGLVSYTPAHDFAGNATVTYTVTDGHLQVQGTLTVTVSLDTTAPVVAVPTTAFGSGRVNETAPLLIMWSARDLSGIKAYEVQAKVGTGGFSTVYSGAATSMTRFYALSKDLVWRVRAQDNLNNWSAWSTSAARRIVAYQEGSSSITRSGTWTFVNSTSSSGTGYRYNTTYLRYAQLRFSGMQVLYVAPKMSRGGSVKVYVDGVYQGRYSTYRSSTTLGQIITRKAWATSGVHTIKIVNAQSGRRTTLDAFIVLR